MPANVMVRLLRTRDATANNYGQRTRPILHWDTTIDTGLHGVRQLVAGGAQVIGSVSGLDEPRPQRSATELVAQVTLAPGTRIRKSVRVSHKFIVPYSKHRSRPELT
jgi:hypothetical protein